MSSGRAEHHDSHSSSSCSTQNTRQSHTIQWAVARYVPIPVINNIDHVLIDKHIGTTPTYCQDKPQCRVDDQAEQIPSQTEHYHEEDQSEHYCPSQTIPSLMQDQPRVDTGRTETCLTDTGAAVDQAEHHGSQSSSSSTLNTRQSHTIKWAVARYVSHPVPIDNF